jgi:hypothetical protein
VLGEHGKADNQSKHSAASRQQIAVLETVPAPFGRVAAILNARDEPRPSQIYELRSTNAHAL